MMEENLRTEEKQIVEYTMGFGKVTLISMLLTIPITAIYLTPFILIWGYDTFQAGKNLFYDHFFTYLLVGVIIHELLHGFTWGYFASNGLKAIKFGVKWKYVAPYCHCTEPLKVKHYKIGGAMPLIIMGIIPSLIGIVSGHGGILSFGIFFSWAAGGDIIALYMLQKIDNDIFVSDLPDKLGFVREIN